MAAGSLVLARCLQSIFGRRRSIIRGLSAIAGVIFLGLAAAGTTLAGERLLATGGVSQIEGAAGGGLVPWAVIAGDGTRDQIGLTVFYTKIATEDVRLNAGGVAVGVHDRLELSLSRQLLGLGATAPGESIRQDVLGLKIRLAGDAVVDQDSWLPQIAVGLQHKKNRDMTIPTSLGARHDTGTDFYVSATKLYLAGLAGRNLLVNATVRATKANQLGLLGFGGDKRDRYQVQLESSVAVFLKDDVLIGAEYRFKPDNLRTFREENYSDLFATWFFDKRASLTLAYIGMGQIADKKNQNGAYLSLQIIP